MKKNYKPTMITRVLNNKYPYPYTKCEGCVFRKFIPLCQMWLGRKLVFSTDGDVENSYKWCFASDMSKGVDRLKAEMEESVFLYEAIQYLLRVIKKFDPVEYDTICRRMDDPRLHLLDKKKALLELKRKIFKRRAKKELVDHIESADDDVLSGDEERYAK